MPKARQEKVWMSVATGRHRRPREYVEIGFWLGVAFSFLIILPVFYLLEK